MPFRELTSRFAGVLAGRIKKRQFISPCEDSRGSPEFRRPSALLTPPPTIKVLPCHVVIKPEPIDDDSSDGIDDDDNNDEDEEEDGTVSFVSVESESQSAAPAGNGSGDKVVLPSVERSQSPEESGTPPTTRQIHFADIRGGRGGMLWQQDIDELSPTFDSSTIWVADAAAGSRVSDQDDSHHSPPEGDSQGLSSDQDESEFEPESSPDIDTVVGEWGVPEAVLEAYEDFKSSIRGSEKWTSTESHLHRLLGLRGHHPLLPGEWKRDFTGVNLEEILFAPIGRGNAVALRCVSPGMSAQYKATKALGRIFSLPSRVGDLRSEGDSKLVPKQTSSLIEKEILRYIAWAEQDAGLDKLFYASNIGVYRLDGEDRSDAEMTEHINGLMAEWADGYRGWYASMGIQGAPRTLFALVILQHVVVILTQDASDPDGECHFLAELDMSRTDGRWLDHALNLVLPINIARECMVRVKDNFAEKPEPDVDSDPDA